MKVRITKCSNKNMWYSDKIGQEFEITEATEYAYKFSGIDMTYSILPSDCEIIPDEPILIAEQPNEKLFKAAVAAMQGLLANDSLRKDFSKNSMVLDAEDLSKSCWLYAEALINEGKKRGHI